MNHNFTLTGALLRLSLLFASIAVASHWGLVPGCISMTVALGSFQA